MYLNSWPGCSGRRAGNKSQGTWSGNVGQWAAGASSRRKALSFAVTWQLLDMGGEFWADQWVFQVLPGQVLGVQTLPPSLPSSTTIHWAPSLCQTSRVAFATITNPRRCSQTPACVACTVQHPLPPCVTTTNVSRRCQMSPEGGEQNGPWLRTTGLVAAASNSTVLAGHRGNAMSHCDAQGHVLGQGTYGQSDIRSSS